MVCKWIAESRSIQNRFTDSYISTLNQFKKFYFIIFLDEGEFLPYGDIIEKDIIKLQEGSMNVIRKPGLGFTLDYDNVKKASELAQSIL